MPSFGPFKGGINNRATGSDLPVKGDGTVLYARNANNLIFNNEGSAFSIPGAQQIYTGLGLRDGWSCQIGAFFRQGTTIRQFMADGSAPVIAQNITGSKVAYAYSNNTMYLTDGIVSKKYKNGVLSTWGVKPPAKAPLLSGGSVMGTGQVMGCYTFVLDDQTESAASPIVISQFGRKVSGLMTSNDSRVIGKKIYLTVPNNSTFYHVATVNLGQQEVEITKSYSNGSRLRTLGKIPPPPGHIICQAFGRMYVAKGSEIWYSELWSHDLFAKGEQSEGIVKFNFWQFSEKVTLMEPVEGGMWIGAGKILWVAGKNPDKAEPLIKSEEQAVFGTSVRPGDGSVIWGSSAGDMIGSPNGDLSLPQESNIAIDQASQGAAGLIGVNGAKIKVTTLLDPKSNLGRAKGWQPIIGGT